MEDDFEDKGLALSVVSDVARLIQFFEYLHVAEELGSTSFYLKVCCSIL